MPFCTACGNPVSPAAAYCPRCGAQQPPAKPASAASPGEEWLADVPAQTASTLCYIPFAGWLVALILLSTRRFRLDRLVRFHAFQGLYLFVVWMLIDMAFAPFLGFAGGSARRSLSGIMHLAILVAWVLMVYRTFMGELVRLPVLGELAERSVAEQRS